MWRRYLLWFAHEHVDFRHSEMDSILSMFKIPIKFIEKPCVSKPYWVVEFPSDECVKKVASRSLLLKNCIELWSRATTVEQLHNNLKNSVLNATGEWQEIMENEEKQMICPKQLIESCCPVDKSFKVEVETFCKHFSMKEKVAKIEQFSYLPLEGPVKLKAPDVTLNYLEFYGADPNNVPELPYDVFFGRWIADGQRDLIQYHSLKKRKFIGNTSMDAQLALLMANQARVRAGDVIIDPFVGSGSLLVAAAHFGAYVWGSDIDFMMVHARTRPTRVGQKVRAKEESIKSNLSQYGSRPRFLDVLVSDFSLPLWRDDVKFDAIITDPPYGVREPTEKIGIERDNYILSPAHLESHVPAKVAYETPRLYSDLLDFAARHLAVGGRLVTWYPVVREDYTPSTLPTHPALSLMSNSEQVLSRLTARRLLTYERRREEVGEVGGGGGGNFREKYFSLSETTRKERKQKRAEEIEANLIGRTLAEQRLIDVT